MTDARHPGTPDSRRHAGTPDSRRYPGPPPRTPDSRRCVAPPDSRRYVAPPDSRRYADRPPDSRRHPGATPDSRRHPGATPDSRRHPGPPPDSRRHPGATPGRHPGAPPDSRRHPGAPPDPRRAAHAGQRPEGARYGRYEVLAELGRGGCGIVFRARDPRYGREVALKALVNLSPRARKRFGREVRALGRLKHPHLVGLLDSGEDGGLPYLVMELVRGETLAARLERGPLPPLEAARILVDVARAVEHAHQEGVLHRDLKPQNVLLDEGGRPRVVDFGLARLVDSGTLTASGAVLGTPTYMAPEQADPARRRGGRLDERADVYGLGATLYHALTGRPPFLPGPALVMDVVEREPEPPSAHARRVPADLDTICRKCLEKDAWRRYPGAGELAEDLERWLAGEPILARPPSTGERLRRWLGRRPVGVAAAAAAAALLLVGAALVGRAAGGAEAGGAAGGGAAGVDPTAAGVVGEVYAEAREGPQFFDVEAAVARLTGERDPGVVAAATAGLERTTAALAEVEREVYAEVVEPGPSEVRRGADRLDGLAEAVAARQAHPLAEPLPLRIRGPLAEADRRLADRAELKGRLDLTTALDVVADRQVAALGRGELLGAEAMARFLGRQDGAGPAVRDALAGYLRVEADELRAVPAAEALLATGGAEGALAVLGAVERYGLEGVFARRLRPALARARIELPEPAGDAPSYLHRARRLRAMDDLAGALADCTRAIELAPELAPAWALRGAVRDELGDRTAALADLDRALALEPNDALSLARRGRVRVDAGDLAGGWADLAQAEELAPRDPRVLALRGSYGDIERALEVDPDNVEALVHRASLRYGEGDYEGAVADCERALEVDPRSAMAYCNRGAARLGLGQPAGALADLSRATELDPENAGNWANLAALEFQRGHFEAAVEAATRALGLDPKETHALSTRGLARYRLGDPRQGLADLDEAVRLRPFDATSWANRSLARRELGDHEGALADAEKAVEIDPKDEIAWNNLGLVLGELGRFAEAAEAYQRAIGAAPRESAFHMNLGDARRERGDLAGALEAYDRAVALAPDDAVTWTKRGVFRKTTGDLAGAIGDFTQAIERSAQPANAYSWRGVTRLAAGDPRGALEDCTAAIQANPVHALSWARRAAIQRELGDLEAAVADASRALELDPRAIPDAWVMRGMARLELGDAQGGVDDLVQFLRVAPRHPRAPQIQALLQRLTGGG